MNGEGGPRAAVGWDVGELEVPARRERQARGGEKHLPVPHRHHGQRSEPPEAGRCSQQRVPDHRWTRRNQQWRRGGQSDPAAPVTKRLHSRHGRLRIARRARRRRSAAVAVHDQQRPLWSAGVVHPRPKSCEPGEGKVPGSSSTRAATTPGGGRGAIESGWFREFASAEMHPPPVFLEEDDADVASRGSAARAGLHRMASPDQLPESSGSDSSLRRVGRPRRRWRQGAARRAAELDVFQVSSRDDVRQLARPRADATAAGAPAGEQRRLSSARPERVERGGG